MRTRWIVAGLIAVEAAIALSPVMFSNKPHQETPVQPEPQPVAAKPQLKTLPPAPEPVRARPAPVVEPVAVIEQMSRAELEATIDEIDSELASRNAIERLNAEQVSEDEREELGALLERGALMRNQLARLDLLDLERALAEYEAGHQARVAQFVPQH